MMEESVICGLGVEKDTGFRKSGEEVMFSMGFNVSSALAFFCP